MENKCEYPVDIRNCKTCKIPVQCSDCPPSEMIEVCIGKEGQDMWVKDKLCYTLIDPNQPNLIKWFNENYTKIIDKSLTDNK